MKGMSSSSLVLCLCLSFSPMCLGNINFIDADLVEVRTMAVQEGKLYFAYFSASWCLPCQWMEKNTFTDTALGNYVASSYLAVKIDVDDRNGLATQQQYDVKMLPSILIFNSQGVLIDRQEESLTAEQLITILYRHDLPRNRIRSTLQDQEEVLKSPRANLSIHRPALVPDAGYNATPSHSKAYPTPATESPPYHLVNPNATQSPPPAQVYQPNTVAPRSNQRYGIQVGSYNDYNNAVRRINQLEAQFDQAVRLVANQEKGSMSYKIIIGVFPDRAAAEDYLAYLQQNGVDGFVRGEE